VCICGSSKENIFFAVDEMLYRINMIKRLMGEEAVVNNLVVSQNPCGIEDGK
jgi:hypothetical protein